MTQTAPNVPPTLPEDVAPEIGYNTPRFTNYLFTLMLLAGPAYFATAHVFQASKYNGNHAGVVGVSIIISLISFLVTKSLIPHVKQLTQKAGLFGKDLNKGEVGRKIPEALGIVPATVFIVAGCALQAIMTTLGAIDQDKLTQFNAGLFTTCFMVFLGFADDVLELRWRYKLILPAFACLPLVMSYSGVTTIIIPKPFAALIGTSTNLGIFYKVYMGLLSVFCANSINILAGVNGLEAGQALVIACAIVIHNCIELAVSPVHLYSLMFMIIFIGITLGLLSHNWYPSKVFVGDTFTYFAGVSFAVVAILGHFSKTLMLFFIPQWINFFLSVPQLVGWKECPRHRLPKYDEKTRMLNYSDNYTLLNAILYLFGPKSEKTLTLIVLCFQVACCAFGFVVRYYISKFFYDK